MGVKTKNIQPFYSLLLFFYFIIINLSCDKTLINCDLVIEQPEITSKDLELNKMFQISNDNSSNLNINSTQLKQIVMDGLNMRQVPDMDKLNISQEEYFTKYAEYLSKMNHREKILSKYYGNSISDGSAESFSDDDYDDNEYIKKIFAFKHSNQSIFHSEKRRVKRGVNEDDITYLQFDLPDKDEMPKEIEESTLNIFLTSSHSYKSLDLVVDDNKENNVVNQRRFRGRANISQSRRERRKHNKGNKSDSRRQEKQQTLNDPNVFDEKLTPQGHQQINPQRKSVEIITDKQTIRLHVYHLIDEDERVWLFTKDIALPSTADSNSISKWIQLDLNKAINRWLKNDKHQLIIQIYCEHCTKYGLKIFNNLESSHMELQGDSHSQNSPTLNIVGKVIQRLKRKSPRKDKKKDNRKEFMTQPKKTLCHKDKDKKCCRHQWIVNFKDVEGFEFVIQPQEFDAGYCEGTCPYRYNLGNTHAYIQSLLHHSGKSGNVPDVCCAATRVVDMEVLHLDENDPTKLKVSTWKKMRVMKCSCT